MLGQRAQHRLELGLLDGGEDAAELEDDAILQAIGEPRHEIERWPRRGSGRNSRPPTAGRRSPARRGGRGGGAIEGWSLFSSRNQAPRYFWTAA